MSLRPARVRRTVRDLAWIATAVCAVMMVLSAFTLVDARRSPASAATVAGIATLSTTGGETSGGSSAAFSVNLPPGAACSGDSASAGYKVQSYMVPEAVDPGVLKFGNTGPTPAGFGAGFRKPLYSNAGQAFVNKLTDVQTGVVTGLPSFNFALFKPNGADLVPPGTYNLGIACTLGTGETQVLDKYWNAKITITAEAGDANGIGWSIPSSGPTTTTTGGTTTTTGNGTTTTTAGGTTTTTTIVVVVGPPLTLSQDSVSAGGSLTVQASGWMPSSEVEVYLHSDPVLVGTLTADADGNINGPVTIPADTQPGFHTLVALGQDPTDTAMGSSADVTITAASTDTTDTTGTSGGDPFSGGGPSAASPVTVAGQLPYTGSSPVPMVAWAIALLVFGRMAMLLGKRPKVIDGSGA